MVKRRGVGWEQVDGRALAVEASVEMMGDRGVGKVGKVGKAGGVWPMNLMSVRCCVRFRRAKTVGREVGIVSNSQVYQYELSKRADRALVLSDDLALAVVPPVAVLVVAVHDVQFMVPQYALRRAL